MNSSVEALRRQFGPTIGRASVSCGDTIVYVDASREFGTQQHFVLIVGKDEQGYVIHDPYYGDRVPLCPRYGKTDAIAICGVVFYQ